MKSYVIGFFLRSQLEKKMSEHLTIKKMTIVILKTQK